MNNIHYVILQHYNPGELLKEIPYTSNVTFDTKGANFENDIASEKLLYGIKTPLGVILLEKDFFSH